MKAGLDDDERLGVIEKVPDGVPTTWLHWMVVVPKPSGESWRTVDLSPLKKFCKREMHVIGKAGPCIHLENCHGCLEWIS